MLSLLPRILCKGTDWGLRDYGTAKWEGGDIKCDHIEKFNLERDCSGGFSGKDKGTRGEQPSASAKIQFKDICEKCGAKRIDAQIGLEKTPEEYVNKMVDVFREVKRVLKKEGTLWLNLGDTYHGGGGGNYGSGISNCVEGQHLTNVRNHTELTGLKPKDLVGIPWRVAFALQADGWYLRQDIIWSKPNPMPESVTDRCTKSHEYIFLLAKSQKYYFDNEAIKEQGSGRTPGNKNPQKGAGMIGMEIRDGLLKAQQKPQESRNKRSVWTITTKPFSEAHFATFPEDLVEPMIKAGTSEKGVCSECGKPWVRILSERIIPKDAPTDYTESFDKGFKVKEGHGFDNMGGGHKRQEWLDANPIKTLGWKPSCSCGKEPVPAVVLDIFAGSGTTCMVAKELGRNYLGIELNPEYVKIANNSLICMRNRDEMKILKEIDSGKQKTLGLFKV